jgi:multiple antibiotic resistance protein
MVSIGCSWRGYYTAGVSFADWSAEMSIMIILSSDRPSLTENVGLLIVSILTAAMIACTLLLALPINRLIGKPGINIATRVVALFVTAVGVNFIFTGVRSELLSLYIRVEDGRREW